MALQVDYFPAIIAPAKNPVVFKISADVGDPAKEQHKIGLQIFRQGAEADEMIFEDLLSVYYENDRAVALFEISELLLPALKSYFQIYTSPGWNAKIDRPDMILPFYIKYYEEYGDPATQSTLKTSNWFYSLNGGVPSWKRSAFYSVYDNLAKYIITQNRQFLTWHNFAKTTDIQATEKLYFIVPEDPAKFDFVLRVTRHSFDDGDEYDDISIGHSLIVGKVYEMDVSYKSVIESHTGNFSGYSVQVLSVDEEYASGIFEFKMDYHAYPNSRYFVFLNSLGAFEGIRFTGDGSRDIAMGRQFYDQGSLQLYSASTASKGQTDPIVTLGFKVNTGWISNQEMEWIQDFLISPEIYEIKNGLRLPALIKNEKVELRKDNNFLNSLTIDMEYLDYSNVYQRDHDNTWQDVAEVLPPYNEE
ncbi:MAG: hypothetical protein ACOYMF_05335 [Bacteroidales bacterium]